MTSATRSGLILRRRVFCEVCAFIMVMMNETVAPCPCLVPVGLDEGKEALPLDRDIVLIGSGPGCRIQVKHAAISRTHCAIIVDGSDVTLCDLASRNGTVVNKHRVDERKLRSGDIIKIGATKLRFDDPRRGVPTPTAAPSATVTSEGMEPLKIARRSFLIGTRPNCDVIITSPEAGPAHAIICAIGGKYVLRDLGFGTIVNGHSIHQQELSLGDEIDIVGVKLNFEFRQAEPAEKDLSAADDDLIPLDEEVDQPKQPEAEDEKDESGPIHLSDLLDFADEENASGSVGGNS